MATDPLNPRGINTSNTSTSTTTTSPAVQVPAANNVDPNASRPMNANGTVGEPAVSTNTGTPNQPVTNPSAAPSTSPTNQPIPALNLPDQANAILQDSTNQLAEAQAQVTKLWPAIEAAQREVDKQRADPKSAAFPAPLQQATANLNQLYSTLSQLEARVETANHDKATAALKVIDQVALTDDQKSLLQKQAASYDANAELAHQQAANLDPTSPMGAAQRDKLAADTALSNANARLSDATASKAPAEIALLNSQAAQITALLPGLVKKQDAETAQIEATTGKIAADTDLSRATAKATEAQGRLYDAQAALAATTGQVNVAQATQGIPAQAAEARSVAALNQAKIDQAKLGPMYGIQDQINAAIGVIQQHVFGNAPPGADPAQLSKQADDLLNQYVQAQFGGTTPYAAAVAAANAQQNVFQTQAAMYNQNTASNASRANALAGVGGNTLATLAGMNANAPAGSTALVGAFQDVLNNIQGRMNAPGFGAPGNQPTAAALPSFLQNFASGSQSGMRVPLPTPSPVAANTSAASNTGTSGQGVTINIGGGAGGGAQGAANSAAQTTGAGVGQLLSGGTQPGTGAGSTTSATGAADPNALPQYLNGMQSPNMDFLHQLWSKELGSGNIVGLGQMAGY